jgi:hypothetical protein
MVNNGRILLESKAKKSSGSNDNSVFKNYFSVPVKAVKPHQVTVSSGSDYVMNLSFWIDQKITFP